MGGNIKQGHGGGSPETNGTVEVCGEYGRDSCSVNGREIAF
jgi:hypothetical protein